MQFSLYNNIKNTHMCYVYTVIIIIVTATTYAFLQNAIIIICVYCSSLREIFINASSVCNY